MSFLGFGLPELISLGGSVFGSIFGSNQTSKAVEAQTDAANKALQMQWDMYQQGRDDLAPARVTGDATLQALAHQLGLGTLVPDANADRRAAALQKGKESESPFLKGLYKGVSKSYPKEWTMLPYEGADPSFGGLNEKYPAFSFGNVGAQAPATSGRKVATPEDIAAAGSNVAPGSLPGALASPPTGGIPRIPGATDTRTGAPVDSQYLADEPAAGTTPASAGSSWQTDDPGYQFRLDEALKAVDRGAAARTGTLSGAAVKEAERYASGLASQEYQNAFNRALQSYTTNYGVHSGEQTAAFNRLASLAGLGQSAVNTGVNLGSNTAAGATNLMTGIGNVNAAGSVQQGNIWGNLANNMGGVLSEALMRSSYGKNKNGGYYDPEYS